MRRRSSIREAVQNVASCSKSSPQRYHQFFFSPIFFFDLRDGLRRKGGTARSLTPGK